MSLSNRSGFSPDENLSLWAGLEAVGNHSSFERLRNNHHLSRWGSDVPYLQHNATRFYRMRATSDCCDSHSCAAHTHPSFDERILDLHGIISSFCIIGGVYLDCPAAQRGKALDQVLQLRFTQHTRLRLLPERSRFALFLFKFPSQALAVFLCFTQPFLHADRFILRVLRLFPSYLDVPSRYLIGFISGDGNADQEQRSADGAPELNALQPITHAARPHLQRA